MEVWIVIIDNRFLVWKTIQKTIGKNKYSNGSWSENSTAPKKHWHDVSVNVKVTKKEETQKWKKDRKKQRRKRNYFPSTGFSGNHISKKQIAIKSFLLFSIYFHGNSVKRFGYGPIDIVAWRREKSKYTDIHIQVNIYIDIQHNTPRWVHRQMLQFHHVKMWIVGKMYLVA